MGCRWRATLGAETSKKKGSSERDQSSMVMERGGWDEPSLLPLMACVMPNPFTDRETEAQRGEIAFSRSQDREEEQSHLLKWIFEVLCYHTPSSEIPFITSV